MGWEKRGVERERERGGGEERRRGGEGDKITSAAVTSARSAMVPGEHRETPLSGRGKNGSDFFVVDISLIFSEICYSIKQQNYLFT